MVFDEHTHARLASGNCWSSSQWYFLRSRFSYPGIFVIYSFIHTNIITPASLEIQLDRVNFFFNHPINRPWNIDKILPAPSAVRAAKIIRSILTIKLRTTRARGLIVRNFRNFRGPLTYNNTCTNIVAPHRVRADAQSRTLTRTNTRSHVDTASCVYHTDMEERRTCIHTHKLRIA